MTKLLNDRFKKKFRVYLRNRSTNAERILWQKLRGSQMGIKFRRQVSIGPYVVDFYAPQLKMIIEVDGDSHYMEGKQEYDRNREKFLKNLGFRILRFTDSEVHDTLEAVVLIIQDRCKHLPYPLLREEGN